MNDSLAAAISAEMERKYETWPLQDLIGAHADVVARIESRVEMRKVMNPDDPESINLFRANLADIMRAQWLADRITRIDP